MTYQTELTTAMTWLGEKPDTVFLGQGTRYPGHAMFGTLSGVPMEKRRELPVAEEMQMGIGLGIALMEKVVISIYPRFDFLLLAVNQLVNHLDHLADFTHNQYHAKVIVRVGIGSTKPMYPGVQHCGDYTEAFRRMLKMPVASLITPSQILPTYQHAYNAVGSSLIVERMESYGME